MSFEESEARDQAEVSELRRALEAVAETAVPREDCPPPERIWAAVGGELSSDGLRDVVDHTVTCAVCAESWRLAAELIAEEASAAHPEPAEEPGPSENGFWRSWLQVAALMVVLAGAGLLLRPDGAPSPAPVRSGDEAGISALTPQDRALPREAFVLRWTGPAPGLRYDVEVTWITAEASTVVFRAQDLEETEVRVPPEALAELPSEARLLWEVTALDDGQPVEHRTFRARLE